jgi:hypothetical protein
MLDTKKPGKNIKEILRKLGNKYTIKTIDFENCIYLMLDNGYFFEVSGLDNTKKSFNATIYVWGNTKGSKTIETIPNIDSLDMLKDALQEAEGKYLKL